MLRLSSCLHSNFPVGIFDADKGLGSGPSVPIFQYFWSHSLMYQTSPILGWTKTSTENNLQKIFNPKWAQKYDNVGGFKWSWFGPCPLGYRTLGQFWQIHNW